jgi:phospholipid/cholesterol/gamma-HCH transport system substrate-binding protein
VNDYETLQKRRNIIVGLFVLLAFGALVWLMYKFEDLPIRLGRIGGYQVFIKFPSAPGVEEKTSVRFCGFQIGKVTAVRQPEVLKDPDTGKFIYQVIVVATIDSKYNNIPVNVEPKLMTRGFGSSYIELKPKPVDVNVPQREFLVHGSVLQGATTTTSEFFPEETQKKAEELVDKLKNFIDNINSLVGDQQARENIKATLANLAEATKQASISLKEFQRFSTQGSEAFASTEVEVQKVSNAIVGTTDELGKAAAELRLLLEKINKGQGTAGRLVNDGRLYEGLLENSRQLDVLLEELKTFVAELPDKGIPIKLK